MVIIQQWPGTPECEPAENTDEEERIRFRSWVIHKLWMKAGPVPQAIVCL